MNNRNARPAAGTRASETFVVDLTSVCLRSGTVRLPLSMIGRFSEGQHKVTAGGEELTLEFEAPRTLLGLAPFFESAELKANDRVRFVFDGQRLELTAQKRERSRGSRSAAPQDAGPVAAASLGGESRFGPAEARLTGRGVFPAPAQLVELGQESQGAQAEGSTQEEPRTEAAAPGEQWRDNSVRAVRRVRIEGGVPPRTDTAPPRPVDRASAHDVWARRQQAAWRSLDTMIAGPVVPPEEAAEAFSETTVRVVRRSKGTSTPLDVEAPPLRKPETEARTEVSKPESYSMSWPLPEAPRPTPPARPADAPSSRESAPRRTADAPTPEPSEARPKARAELDPYLDAPIDAGREAHYTPPTILESDLLAVPNSGKWRDESEEAFLKYQEAQGATAAAPTEAPTERRQGLLGRLGLGRGGRGPAGGPDTDMAPVRVPASARSTGSAAAWPTHGGATIAAPSGPTAAFTGATHDLKAAASPATPVVSEERPQPTMQARAEKRAQPEQLVIVDESVYDVEFETEIEPQLPAGPAGVATLESDMATLRQYLHQPDVPAIVRCDDLAERLEMSQERVSNAMLRLVEDRERFTPLRGDAYMVRRAR